MKVLLLHPEDSLCTGPWSGMRWDLIVDLGFASPYTYADWSRKLGTRIFSIYQLDEQTSGHRWVGKMLERGRGRLLDRMGLDWWEIIAAAHYKKLHTLYLLEQARREILRERIEIVASRPHLFAILLAQASGCSVRYFQSAGPGILSGAGRMLRSARKLRTAQMAEIAFDKWDRSYRLRRHFSKHKRVWLTEPAILIPSAYSNVTRSSLAYAAQLPHRQFLLTTTRRSAVPAVFPANVTLAPLAAYVSHSSATQAEIAELTRAWRSLLLALPNEATEFRLAASVGLWDDFPLHLAIGLRLRDAWQNLMECEPIKGVLCGDDLNYYTRLPLMLARQAGLGAFYCSHGALDGGFLFKQPQADFYLVKGEMERDYLRRAVAINPEKIVVGAPGGNEGARDHRANAIVFFSQPYEGEAGRVEVFYREILPPLYSAAVRSGRKVFVKLHPFESIRSRRALAASILPEDARKRVEFVGGVPPEEVMSRAWCGVTVDSSVAVECALRGIPFFLCGWLDFMGMGYLQQYAKFGVGRVLNAPNEIENILEMVAEYRTDPAISHRLWREANPSQLDEIMFGVRSARVHPCAC